MDGFFEKFSIYDFFNLLGSGLVFMMGLVAVDIIPVNDLLVQLGGVADLEWLAIIAVLGICYLLGTAFQQISSLVFEKRYCNKLTSSILHEGKTVVDNELKLKVHQEKARKLFSQKKISSKEKDFSPEHCNYYFAYCSYYIQNHNNHHKAEKMRGLRGMYALLIVCFCTLATSAVIKACICVISAEPVVRQLACLVIFVFLFLLCIRAYRENVRYWIKMVLGVYEVCDDIDLQAQFTGSKGRTVKVKRIEKQRLP